MEMKIHFPELVGQEVLRLPDPDAFVTSAVAQALETRRGPQAPRGSQGTGKPPTGRRREPSEVSERHSLPLNNREREDAWRRSNRDFLQAHFARRWVVLEGEEIVAHSEDAAQAVEEARAKGVAAPFVFYVEPPRRPGVVRMGL